MDKISRKKSQGKGWNLLNSLKFFLKIYILILSKAVENFPQKSSVLLNVYTKKSDNSPEKW